MVSSKNGKQTSAMFVLPPYSHTKDPKYTGYPVGNRFSMLFGRLYMYSSISVVLRPSENLREELEEIKELQS